MMQLQKNREPELAGREEADAKGAEIDALLNKKTPANGAVAVAHENGKNGAPFSFVNESNLRNLKYLVKKESPLQIAIVMNYLPPALANDLLGSLDPAVQQEVLTQLSNVSEQDADLVRAMEDKIKEHIGFIVGGEDRLRALLDSADPLTQQTLLSTLSKKDANLAARLRKQLFTIDDLATLEGPVLAAIIRRINARSLAGVLRATPPNVQEKVLASLAPGIAAILKEEINLAKPLPPQKLAQEQRRLLDAIRRLSDEGVIALRKGAA
jgi:flagellar motor switch protein FliG